MHDLFSNSLRIFPASTQIEQADQTLLIEPCQCVPKSDELDAPTDLTSEILATIEFDYVIFDRVNFLVNKFKQRIRIIVH